MTDYKFLEFIVNELGISIALGEKLIDLDNTIKLLEKFKLKKEQFEYVRWDLQRCACGGYPLHYAEKGYANYVSHKIQCSQTFCKVTKSKEWDLEQSRLQSQDRGRG